MSADGAGNKMRPSLALAALVAVALSLVVLAGCVVIASDSSVGDASDVSADRPYYVLDIDGDSTYNGAWADCSHPWPRPPVRPTKCSISIFLSESGFGWLTVNDVKWKERFESKSVWKQEISIIGDTLTYVSFGYHHERYEAVIKAVAADGYVFDGWYFKDGTRLGDDCFRFENMEIEVKFKKPKGFDSIENGVPL